MILTRFRAGEDTNDLPDLALTGLDLKVRRFDLMEPALQQARNVLMLTHEKIEDFSFQTREDDLRNVDNAIRNARLSGGIIALVCLLVGGIGVTNIILVSLSERVQEIGICKAVGATGGPSSSKLSLRASALPRWAASPALSLLSE